MFLMYYLVGVYFIILRKIYYGYKCFRPRKWRRCKGHDMRFSAVIILLYKIQCTICMKKEEEEACNRDALKKIHGLVFDPGKRPPINLGKGILMGILKGPANDDSNKQLDLTKVMACLKLFSLNCKMLKNYYWRLIQYDLSDSLIHVCDIIFLQETHF